TSCFAAAEEDVYSRFVRPLAGTEKSEYWADWRVFGHALGISLDAMPASYEDYRAALARELRQAALSAPDRYLALDTCLELPGIQVPARYRSLLPIVRIAVIGLLPDSVRSLYGLRWRWWHAAQFAVLARLARALHTLVPHRWLGLVDYGGLARAARRTRAESGAARDA